MVDDVDGEGDGEKRKKKPRIHTVISSANK